MWLMVQASPILKHSSMKISIPQLNATQTTFGVISSPGSIHIIACTAIMQHVWVTDSYRQRILIRCNNRLSSVDLCGTCCLLTSARNAGKRNQHDVNDPAALYFLCQGDQLIRDSPER